MTMSRARIRVERTTTSGEVSDIKYSSHLLVTVFANFLIEDVSSVAQRKLEYSFSTSTPISKCVRCGLNPSDVLESDPFPGECRERACTLVLFLACNVGLPLCTEKVMK